MPDIEYPANLFGHYIGANSHIDPSRYKDIDPRTELTRAFECLQTYRPYQAELIRWWLTLPKYTSCREMGERIGISKSAAFYRLRKAHLQLMAEFRECVRRRRWHLKMMALSRQIKPFR